MPALNKIPELNETRKRFISAFYELKIRKIVKTRTEFAEEVGLNNSSNFKRMENGKNFPSISNIILINKKYHVSVKWLLLGIGNIIE